MQNFQDNFETLKQLFITVFSVCMTVPLSLCGNFHIAIRSAFEDFI